MFFYSRKNKRAVQAFTAAALVGTITIPYVVDANTVAASTTAENVDFLLTAGDSFDAPGQMDTYFKSNFVGTVQLEYDADGNPFALIELKGHAYGIPSFTVNGEEAEIVSSTGEAGKEGYVRVVRVALDENYQAKLEYASARGDGHFLFDLGKEDADFELTTGGNEAYFTQWIQQADVITKADGSKVAHVTLAGHSYAAGIEGVTVIASSGSAETKDLVRTVAIPLDENNKGQVLLSAGERGSYTFNFDFTQQAATTTITTAADVTADKQAIDIDFSKAGMPAMFILPGIFTSKEIHAEDGQVVFTLGVAENVSARGSYASLTVKQGEETLASWTAEEGAADVVFAVDTVENITLEVGYLTAGQEEATVYTGALGDVTFAEVIEEAPDASEESGEETPNTDEETEVEEVVETPTYIVRGLRADYSLVPDTSHITTPGLADFLKTYFNEGFFGEANIVTINGNTYADLGLIYKSHGFDPIEYKTADGTFEEVTFIENNETEGKDFKATVRIPVTEEDGAYTLRLRSTGSQPGAEKPSIYEYDFTFKQAQNKFTDVTANAEDIQALYLHNITNGKSATTFAPNGEMKRYEFAVMIARALNLQTENDTKFTDVQGKWYAESVQALYEAGIISGTSDTTFNPNGKLSRQQAAKMVIGVLEHLGYESTATLADLHFKDADKIADSSKLYFAELQKQGIMTGSNGYVKPTDPLKRGQMAKVLKRSLDLVDYFEQ